ncbi:MAG: D-arabinose 5-phosphate isomerase [Candidatus Melainabacteria bacterium RIFCSPHIGHO2_02_FULL_34_12]|nr:MAG: D-arabinose 5-phosphate isomerase [Candidatus Melainabacteria bacterium RIFCSPHIGHO2_02_FULL_34_12]
MLANLTVSKHIQNALAVLDIEQEAIKNLILDLEKNQIENFEQTIESLISCKGRIVVTGMGKSGHIANKIAATLASTGSPAFFVHPAELSHGDFGMLTSDDVMLALSFSGETEELKKLLIQIKRLGIKLISITGNESSTIAQNSDVVLFVRVEKEACPLNLAPTASTTATLALGDAIAITLMQAKNFTREDFAKSHPGGSLGKKLIKVKDIMRQEKEIPLVKDEENFKNILNEINTKKLGFTIVQSNDSKLLGVITDGDIRRAFLKYQNDIDKKLAKEIMSLNPRTIDKDDLAVSALKIMEDFRISDLIVTDKMNKLIGIVDLKDLLRAGII